MRPPITVVVGPTCSGKTTYVDYLCKNLGYSKIVTYTTRPPREGEIDGVDYHFISVQDFEKRYREFTLPREFTVYNGDVYYYGVLTSDIEKFNNSLLILDPDGAMELYEKYPDKVFITLITASPDELIRRGKGRGDNLSEVKNRILRDKKSFDILYESCYIGTMISTDNGKCNT